MHATARAKEKLQKSQEQLHALREQVGSRQNLQVSLDQPGPTDSPVHVQCQTQATVLWELEEELCCQLEGKEKLHQELLQAKDWTSSLLEREESPATKPVQQGAGVSRGREGTAHSTH